MPKSPEQQQELPVRARKVLERGSIASHASFQHDFFFPAPNDTNEDDPKKFRLLALGDSYTVAETLHITKAFPNEIARLLSDRSQAFSFESVDVTMIAKTGWTADELMVGIQESKDTLLPPTEHYDLVTLLIGVNNQYRGRSSAEYAEQFDQLLLLACDFAGGDASKVAVISIPDYGVTPFARENGKDIPRIAAELDLFNSISKMAAERAGAMFYDITFWTRQAAGDPSYLADDGLHPSSKEYSRWAAVIIETLRSRSAYTAPLRGRTGVREPSDERGCNIFDLTKALSAISKGIGLL